MRLKYNNVRTYSELCQREFASKKEAQRAEELTLLQRAGEITDLKFQIPFILSVKPKITITIDFSYVVDGVFSKYNVPIKILKYEDSKGVLTRDTRTKLAWVQEKHGVSVILS